MASSSTSAASPSRSLARGRIARSGAALAVWVALSWACAPVSDTSPPAPAAPAASIELVPASPAASHYGVVDAAPPETPLHRALFELVRERAAELKLAPPGADARLCSVGDDLARFAAAGSPPSFQAIELVLSRYGVIEPAPQLVILRGQGALELARAMQQLRARLDAPLQSARPRHMGAGVAETADGYVVALVLLQSHVELAPFPRVVTAGGSVRLRGRLLAPFTRPELIVTGVAGGTLKKKPKTRDGGFDVPVDCPAQAGRQQVELMAEGPHGPTVVANFPLWCGVSPPASLSLGAAPRAEELRDPRQLERRVFALLNDERRLAGLAPLLWDERAAAVARAHSADMSEHDFVGHVSPSTGGPDERAARAGVRTPLVLENVALAYSAQEVHQGLMASPGHRANILSAEATHVGVGVVVGDELGGAPTLHVTQLFLRVPELVAPEVAQQAVYEAAARKRAQGRLSALARDATLERLAQSYAERLRSGKGKAEPPALDAVAGRYATVSTVVAVVGEPSAAVTEALLDARTHALGAGVAQGDHPQLGANVFYVVVVLGRL